MQAVELTHIAKSFAGVPAVTDVSFEVRHGEIFGLLGPNGAGKTTTIRMALDILRPDRGTIVILGGAMDEARKNRIGYMPEERGLYPDVPLERGLLYLASLKDVPGSQARRRLGEYLERFGLAGHQHKKVKDLSKGMQQKAQLISTLLHQPELIIVDEPFSGLDPVNVQLVREVLRELRTKGAAIIMSTHQMHQVEELCDRLALIHAGRVVLAGEPVQIRRRFASHAVIVRSTADLPDLPGVRAVSPQNGGFRLSLTDECTPQAVLAALVARGTPVESFEVALPTLEEVFIQVVGQTAA